MSRPTTLYGPWARLAEKAGGVGHLAAYLHVSTMTLWRWSNGRGFPDDHALSRIAALDGGATTSEECPYCGRFVPSTIMTQDHIIPISRGGPSQPHNIMRVCAICNSAKNDRTPSEWLGARTPPDVLRIESDIALALPGLLPRTRKGRTEAIEKRRQLAVYLSAAALRKLGAIARRTGISRSAAVEKMISRYPLPKRPTIPYGTAVPRASIK